MILAKLGLGVAPAPSCSQRLHIREGADPRRCRRTSRRRLPVHFWVPQPPSHGHALRPTEHLREVASHASEFMPLVQIVTKELRRYPDSHFSLTSKTVTSRPGQYVGTKLQIDVVNPQEKVHVAVPLTTVNDLAGTTCSQRARNLAHPASVSVTRGSRCFPVSYFAHRVFDFVLVISHFSRFGFTLPWPLKINLLKHRVLLPSGPLQYASSVFHHARVPAKVHRRILRRNPHRSAYLRIKSSTRPVSPRHSASSHGRLTVARISATGLCAYFFHLVEIPEFPGPASAL